MADAERGKIGGKAGGASEVHAAAELEPVRRGKQSHLRGRSATTADVTALKSA